MGRGTGAEGGIRIRILKGEGGSGGEERRFELRWNGG